MGYLAGRVATEALLGIKGDITKESVNAAFKALKNFASDLWCKPWYFDSTVGKNVSNNIDITVAPKDGNMVQIEDCFEIAELPTNPLAADPGQGDRARPERRLAGDEGTRVPGGSDA